MKPRSCSVPRTFIEEVFGRAVPACQYSNLPPDLFYHHKRHYKSIPCASSSDLLKLQMANSPACHLRIERAYHSKEKRHASPNTSFFRKCCRDTESSTASHRVSNASSRAETRCASALGDRRLKGPYEKENAASNSSQPEPRTVHPSAAYLAMVKAPMKLKPKLMDLRVRRTQGKSRYYKL